MVRGHEVEGESGKRKQGGVMSDNYSEIKRLYMDYYMETCRQEKLIEDKNYRGVNESMAKRGEIINKINSMRGRIPAEKWKEISEILQETVTVEKKNRLQIDAELKETRVKLNKFRNRKKNIIRYNTQNVSI